MFQFDPNNRAKYKQLVSVSGFYATGSSAVLDLLREFDNTTVLHSDQDPETKTQTQDGCGEISYYANMDFKSLKKSFFYDDDSGFNGEMISFILNYYNLYRNKVHLYARSKFNSDPFFKHCIDEFLISILDLTPNDIKVIRNDKNFFFLITSEPRMVEVPTQMPNEISVKIKYPELSFNKGYYIFYSRKKGITEGEFDHLLVKLHRTLFEAVPSRDVLVLDQFLAEKPYIYHYNMLPEIKQIVVVRDIRDSYFMVLKESFTKVTSSIHDYADYMLGKHILKDYKNSEHNLIVWLEDLIFNYDSTVKQITDFLSISEDHHVNKRAYFDPSISVKSIGLYKLYHDQNAINELKSLYPQMIYRRN